MNNFLSLVSRQCALRSLPVCAVIAFLALSVSPTQANAQKNSGTQALKFDLSKPLTLSDTEVPGAWYPDRFKPCTFASQATPPAGSGQVLQQTICSADFQSPAPSFYNTQGRKYDVVPNTYAVSVKVYIPAAWQGSPQRLAAVWATASNSSNVVGNDFPIIEFQGPIGPNSPKGPGFYQNGGVAGFYGWDNTLGTFVSIGLPPNFKYNSWVQLTISVVAGSGFQYTVGDPNTGRSISMSSPFYDPTESSFSNMILEGYNYDSDYSIYWKDVNFSFTSLSCSTATPAALSPIIGPIGRVGAPLPQ